MHPLSRVGGVSVQLQAVAASELLPSTALSLDRGRRDHWLAVPSRKLLCHIDLLASSRMQQSWCAEGLRQLSRQTWASMLPSHLTTRCGLRRLSAAGCCMRLDLIHS